ncbi:MAG: SDR family oxidoreductase, partial [Gammaproteobacteria bacterium]|nr:SDR family oxidoreductase [Gammaproteobacteria bacterium]
MQKFIDKTAVVTGAAGGMGLAVASALARRGANVRILDQKPAPVLPKGKVEFMQGDVSKPEFVEKAFDGLTKLDYLVNAAGVLWLDKDKGMLEVDLDVWDRVMSINLKSMVLTMRAAIPLMQAKRHGSIVNFSTIQCMRGDALPQDAYQASKAGVIALTKSVAIQYAK